MESPLYIVDQENVTFRPKTCNEAIILFNRLKRKNQVQWEYIPELLQRLACDLDESDHDRFCEWVCNPTSVKAGPPGYFADLCQEDHIPAKPTIPDPDDEKTPTPNPAVRVTSGQKPEYHNKPCGSHSCSDGISAAPDKLVVPKIS